MEIDGMKFELKFENGVGVFVCDDPESRAAVNQAFYNLWQSGNWMTLTVRGQAEPKPDRFYPYPVQRHGDADGEFAWRFHRVPAPV